MRRLLVILGIVVAAVVGALAIAVFNLDSYINENRDWISEQAQSALGREVSFGEVSISLADGLAVRVADLRVGDDPAFSKQHFVTADAIDVQVAILPALLGEIEVGRAVLRSPSITVIQTSRGLNTDSLGGGGKAESPGAAPGSPAPFVIGVVDISNGTLRFIDRTVDPPVERAIERLDFRATDVSLTGPIVFEIDAALLGAQRQNVHIAGEVADLSNPQASFVLTSDALELAPADAGAPPGVIRNLELNGHLSLPKSGPHVKATVRSSGGSFAGAEYQNLAVDLELRGQRAVLEKLSLEAFGGNLEASGTYDMRDPKRPRFDLHSTLADMNLRAVVASRSSNAARLVEGTLGGVLDLNGAGSVWDEIKRTLTGTGALELADGMLKDVNLAESALRGVTGVAGLSGLLPPTLRAKYPQVFGVGDTVFETAVAKLSVRDGWAYFRDFQLAARDYALGGDGRYSLDNRLELATVLTFSAALSEDLVDAAKPMKYLRGADGRVQLPVKLVGPLPSVQPVPDLSYVAQVASRQAVGALLEKALKDSYVEPESGEPSGQPTAEDAARDLIEKGLGDLFGR